MSARHPAAISTSLGTTNAVTQAQYLLSKMLGSSPEERVNMLGSSSLHTQVYTQMFGIDQNGRPYANFPFDGVGGGSGAVSFADGIDHGGGLISALLRIGNAEEWERVIPFLYLYRREVPAGGGHGSWRGGAGLVTAWTGWKTDESFIASGGVFQSVTQGNGLSGGYPGSGGTFWAAERTSIADAFAGGTWPATPPELRALAPHGALPPAKKFDNPLRAGDVFEVLPPLGAGHGDPLLRDPDLVARDVARGRLSAEDAGRLYGVVLDEEGSPDVGGTTGRRQSICDERLASAVRKPAERRGAADADAPELCHALETVVVLDVEGEPKLCCAYCREVLGGLAEGYRDGCGWVQTELQSIDPAVFLDPRTQVDEVLVLRHYACPGCASLLDADVCRPDDPAYQDVAIFETAAVPAGMRSS